MRTIAIISAAATSLHLLHVHPAQAQSTTWSQPTLLGGVRADASIRWPSLVLLHDTLILAGNAVPRSDRPDGRSLILLRSPGGAITPPAGAFYFFFPKLIVDSGQRLHLVWGEPADTVLGPGLVPPIAQLWHSFEERGHWSQPEKFFDARDGRIAWEDHDGVTAVDGRGALHVAVPATIGGALKIMHMRRDTSGAWAVRELAQYGLYASVAAWGRESLVAAYVMPEPAPATRGARQNLVLVTVVSPDGGTTWSAPQPLSIPAAPTLRSPVLLRVNDVMHIVWMMKENGRPGNGTLRHAAISTADLTRGSNAWRLAAESELRPGFHLRSAFAVSRCAGTTALVETIVRPSSTESRPMIEVVRWSTTPGSEPAPNREPFFERFERTLGAGIIARGDGFDAVFSASEPGADTTKVFVTHGAVCPRASR